jgi:hypothetical protein
VLAVVVEEDEVSGHNLVSLAEPLPLAGHTTRKKATRSARVLVTHSAWLVRCGYHATGN